MTDSNFAFANLPAAAYPFTVTFFRGAEVVHTIEVPGPGAAIVPKLGNITKVRLVFADGQVVEAHP